MSSPRARMGMTLTEACPWAPWDVSVSVVGLLDSRMVFRSSQSVALVTAGSCVVNVFCERGGWKHEGTPGEGAHGISGASGLH